MSARKDTPYVSKKTRRAVGVSLSLLLISSSILLNAQPVDSEPSPPDISDCNRIEVEFLPSVVSVFNTLSIFDIWNEEDLSYFESLNPFVLEDEIDVSGFIYMINNAIYSHGVPRVGTTYRVTCFRDNETITSFRIEGNTVVTGQDVFVMYDSTWEYILRRLTRELRPYDVRQICADNIFDLSTYFIEYRISGRLYPDPNQWNDELLSPNPYSLIEQVSPLTCPGVYESHYAMNPLCEPNSPDDTVLLFETTTGWNQHGGPELFTFDHHDPKGGMIVLNNGKVKFIRTAEELHSLRWNPNDPNSPDDASD